MVLLKLFVSLVPRGQSEKKRQKRTGKGRAADGGRGSGYHTGEDSEGRGF